MAAGGNNILQTLQAKDPQVVEIIGLSKFVVAYFLQQDGDQPGWTKANIEGPVYVVRRRQAPWFQLVVKNQFSSTDMTDFLAGGWELDCQKNYIFYKVEDDTQQVRGLWFQDDTERLTFEKILEKVLTDIRQGPPVEPQPEPVRTEQHVREVGHQFQRQQQAPQQPAAQVSRNPAKGQVMVTTEGLSAALHALAEDEKFLNMIMQKLSENQGW